MQTARAHGRGNGRAGRCVGRAHGPLRILTYAIAGALTCGPTAWAQTPDGQTARVPAAALALPASPAPASSAPNDSRPSGPQNCDSFVPRGIAIPPNIVPSLFSYTSTLSGDMRDVALFRSSGNSDLDKAALACAGTFHGSPPMVEGRPAEITWVGAVIWNKPWHTLVPAASADDVRSCPSSRHPFPPIDVGLPFQGTAYVRFHIAGDGSVKDLSLVRSSGDGGLDKLTLQCVAAWKYFSPTQNGKPVEIEQQWNMVWELGRK